MTTLARFSEYERKSRPSICFNDKVQVAIHHLQELLPCHEDPWLTSFTREDPFDDEESLR
jgi:hypothetical protein